MKRLLVIAATALVAWLLAGAAIDQGAHLDRQRFAVPDAPRVVTDREGEVIQVVRGGGVDQRWVSLGAVSPHLVTALLAAEDQRFYSHRGVDLRASARAVMDAVIPWRRRTGASTITQQVIKLTHGRPRGLWSKPLEVIRALALERAVSKDEILLQYVNRVPFGHNVVGVARACEVFLGRGPGAVTLAEAALLAALPQSPSRLDPALHLRRAVARRDRILRRMRDAGFIDERALADALAEAPRWATGVHPRGAERFVDALLRAEPDRDSGLPRGSLDAGLQRGAAALMAGTVARWRARGATNGAAVVLSNRTGEVLAYVGAADPAGPGGALDLLRAPRQPGSTLKPFVYNLLFARGATPATVLADVQVPLRGARGETAEARDYDGRERGPVRAREALASSLNLAALDAAAQVGAAAIVDELRALGITVPGDARRYGPGVVLGGLDVSPLALAHAYLTLARQGSRIPLSWAVRADEPTARSVMGAAGAAMTWDVLSDEAARARGFGRSLRELAPQAPFALKTGTSSRWRDAWCAVADRRFTVLVWLGDPAGAPMAGVSGFEAAAPTAVRLLSLARESLPRWVAWDPPPAGAARSDVAVAATPSLDARYAAWIERARPAHLAVTETAPSVVRVIDPQPGRTLLLAGTGGAIPLRATRCAASEALRFVVDGSALRDAAWSAPAGSHSIVACCAARCSAPVAVTVERR
ncbi:MAG: transglycosylase domain-containing protein [Deltaproteobacteria bacterium]|nr:transglycosylase domain-containing protein [Myxococcales bacterium]MDP3220175.1 transglycosylase domain-containing protein [Deltaproteobacteria bacterium]